MTGFLIGMLVGFITGAILGVLAGACWSSTDIALTELEQVRRERCEQAKEDVAKKRLTMWDS